MGEWFSWSKSHRPDHLTANATEPHGVLASNAVPIDGLVGRIGRDIGSVVRPKVFESVG
jgi:hypothetical protein